MRSASLAASKSPLPVGVLLDGIGHVVVNDQSHIGHVDTTSRHVGGNQHVEHILAEALR